LRNDRSDDTVSPRRRPLRPRWSCLYLLPLAGVTLSAVSCRGIFVLAPHRGRWKHRLGIWMAVLQSPTPKAPPNHTAEPKGTSCDGSEVEGRFRPKSQKGNRSRTAAQSVLAFKDPARQAGLTAKRPENGAARVSSVELSGPESHSRAYVALRPIAISRLPSAGAAWPEQQQEDRRIGAHSVISSAWPVSRHQVNQQVVEDVVCISPNSRESPAAVSHFRGTGEQSARLRPLVRTVTLDS